MKVRLLTPEQAALLAGQIFKDGQFFNPMQDANGNYILSLQEAHQCENEAFDWVKDLPEIPFAAPTFLLPNE